MNSIVQIIFPFVLMLIPFSSFSQTIVKTWEVNHSEMFVDYKSTIDSNNHIHAITHGSSATSAPYQCSKYDGGGSLSSTFSTIISGGANDFKMTSMAIDNNGNRVIVGHTTGNFNPSAGCYQSAFGGGLYDGFIEVVNNTNQILWSTFFGGPNIEEISSCCTDVNGNVYITGVTRSFQGIASPGAFQTQNNTDTITSAYGNYGCELFAAKFNSFGVLQWSTYFGSKMDETQGYGGYVNGGGEGKSIAVDNNGNVFIIGYQENNYAIVGNLVLSTPGSFFPNYDYSITHSSACFLVKFDTNGNRVWCTYLPGETYGCQTDNQNNIVVFGQTRSNTLVSSSNAPQPNLSVASDGFIIKFNTNGAPIWGTYLGGNGDEGIFSCETNTNGDLLVCGNTSSTNNISTPNGPQPNLSVNPPWTNSNAFLVKYDNSGNRIWGTYFNDNFDNTYGMSCLFGNGFYYLLANGAIDSYIIKYSESLSSVNDIKSDDNALNVFPNPSLDGHLNIDIKGKQNHVQSLDVYNLFGEKLYSNIKFNSNTLDLSFLTSGIYLLKLSVNEQVCVRKIIIK